jgi:hypothetical protein
VNHGRAKTGRGAVEVKGGPTSSLACFPFVTGDGAAPGLFVPTLILSTPALGEVTVVATFDTEAADDATTFGKTPAPSMVLAPDADLH